MEPKAEAKAEAPAPAKKADESDQTAKKPGDKGKQGCATSPRPRSVAGSVFALLLVVFAGAALRRR